MADLLTQLQNDPSLKGDFKNVLGNLTRNFQELNDSVAKLKNSVGGGSGSNAGSKGTLDPTKIVSAVESSEKALQKFQKNADMFSRSIAKNLVSPLEKIPLIGKGLSDYFGNTFRVKMNKNLTDLHNVFAQTGKAQDKYTRQMILGSKQIEKGSKQLMDSMLIATSGLRKTVNNLGSELTKPLQKAWKHLDNQAMAIQWRVAKSMHEIQKKIEVKIEQSPFLSKMDKRLNTMFDKISNSKFFKAAQGGVSNLVHGAGNLIGGGLGKFGEGMLKAAPIIGKIFAGAVSIGAVVGGIALLAAALLPVLAAVSAIGVAFKISYEMAMQVWQNTIKVRKEMGLTYSQAKKLQNVITPISDHLLQWGISMETVTANAEALVNAFGTLDTVTGKMGKTNLMILTKLTDAYGVQADTGAKIITGMEKMLGYSADRVNDFMKEISTQANFAGVSFGQVISDVAGDMELIAKAGSKNLMNLTKAAIQAKAMGNSVQTLSKLQDNFEDLENVMQKIGTLQFLTGKAINPFELMFASQTGDYEKLQSIAMDSMKSMREAGRDYDKQMLTVKKQLAEGFGLTVEEMAKINAYSKMTPDQIKKSKEQTQDWENALQSINTIWDGLKNTFASFINKVFRPFSNDMGKSMENMNKRLETFKNFMTGNGGIAERIQKVAQYTLNAFNRIFGGSMKADSKDFFSTILDFVESIATWTTNTLEEWTKPVDGESKIEKYLKKAQNFYHTYIEPLIESAKELFRPSPDGSYWTNIGDKMSNLLKDVVDSLKTPFTMMLMYSTNKVMQGIPILKKLAMSDEDMDIKLGMMNQREKYHTAQKMEDRTTKGLEQWEGVNYIDPKKEEARQQRVSDLKYELELRKKESQQELDKQFQMAQEHPEFSTIGNVNYKAAGGLIMGPGTGTSDSIPARLSNGEFVSTAAATSSYRPVLEAMNKNKFAKGTPSTGSGNVFDNILLAITNSSAWLQDAWKVTFGITGKYSIFALLRDTLGYGGAKPYLENISNYFDANLVNYKDSLITRYNNEANTALSTNDGSNARGGFASAWNSERKAIANNVGGSRGSRPMMGPGFVYNSSEHLKRYASGGTVVLNRPQQSLLYSKYPDAARSPRLSGTHLSLLNRSFPGRFNRAAGGTFAEGGQTYSKSDIASFAAAVGIPSDQLNVAASIALAESSGRAGITNKNNNGSTDYGLWQINSIHNPPVPGILNPNTNAKYAYQVSHKGTQWNPWVTYKTGAYKEYMNLPYNVSGIPMSATPTSTGLINPGFADGGMTDRYIPGSILMQRLGLGFTQGAQTGSSPTGVGTGKWSGTITTGDIAKYTSGANWKGVNENVIRAAGQIAGTFGPRGAVFTSALAPRPNNPRSRHPFGEAIDVGSSGARGRTANNQAPIGDILDEVAAFVGQNILGINGYTSGMQRSSAGQILWRVKDHYNHVHFHINPGFNSFAEGGDPNLETGDGYAHGGNIGDEGLLGGNTKGLLKVGAVGMKDYGLEHMVELMQEMNGMDIGMLQKPRGPMPKMWKSAYWQKKLAKLDVDAIRNPMFQKFANKINSFREYSPHALPKGRMPSSIGKYLEKFGKKEEIKLMNQLGKTGSKGFNALMGSHIAPKVLPGLFFINEALGLTEGGHGFISKMFSPKTSHGKISGEEQIDGIKDAIQNTAMMMLPPGLGAMTAGAVEVGANVTKDYNKHFVRMADQNSYMKDPARKRYEELRSSAMGIGGAWKSPNEDEQRQAYEELISNQKYKEFMELENQYRNDRGNNLGMGSPFDATPLMRSKFVEGDKWNTIAAITKRAKEKGWGLRESKTLDQLENNLELDKDSRASYQEYQESMKQQLEAGRHDEFSKLANNIVKPRSMRKRLSDMRSSSPFGMGMWNPEGSGTLSLGHYSSIIDDKITQVQEQKQREEKNKELQAAQNYSESHRGSGIMASGGIVPFASGGMSEDPTAKLDDVVAASENVAMKIDQMINAINNLSDAIANRPNEVYINRDKITDHIAAGFAEKGAMNLT